MITTNLAITLALIGSAPVNAPTSFELTPQLKDKESFNGQAVVSNDGVHAFCGYAQLISKGGSSKFGDEILRYYYSSTGSPVVIATTSQSKGVSSVFGVRSYVRHTEMLAAFSSSGFLSSFDVELSGTGVGTQQKRYQGIVLVQPSARGSRPNAVALFPQGGGEYRVYHCTPNDSNKSAVLLVGATNANVTTLQAYSFGGTRLTRLGQGNAGPYKTLVGRRIPSTLAARENISYRGPQYKPRLADIDPVNGRAAYRLQDGVVELDMQSKQQRTIRTSPRTSDKPWRAAGPAWYLGGRLFVTKMTKEDPAWRFMNEGVHFTLLRIAPTGSNWKVIGSYRKLGMSSNEKHWVYQDSSGRIFVGSTGMLAK